MKNKFLIFLIFISIVTINLKSVNVKAVFEITPFAMCQEYPTRRYLTYYSNDHDNPKETFGQNQIFCSPPGSTKGYYVSSYEYIAQESIGYGLVRFVYSVKYTWKAA